MKSSVADPRVEGAATLSASTDLAAGPRLRILLVDDHPLDAELTQAMLASGGSTVCRVDLAASVDEAYGKLCRTGYSLCLVDYFLGKETALDLLARLPEDAPPMVVLTGCADGDHLQSVDRAVLAAGALDCLPKDELTPSLLCRTIRHSLHTHALQQRLRHELAERTRTNRELERARGEQQALLLHLPGALWTTDAQLVIRSVGGLALQQLELSPSDLVGRSLLEVLDGSATESRLLLQAHELARRGEPADLTVKWRGRRFQVHLEPLHASETLSETPDSPLVMGVALDVTDRHRAEQSLSAMVSKANCIFWDADVWDDGGDRLRWNQRILDEGAARRFFPVDQRVGQSYVSAWYYSRLPEDRERMDQHGNDCVREGHSYQQEFRCRALDGSIRWFLEDVQVEPVGGGRWLAVGVCTDITERKVAEDALRRSEERFRELAESIDQVFWSYTPSTGQIDYISPALERLWGRPVSLLQGGFGPFVETIHADDRLTLLRSMEGLVNGEFCRVEYRLLRPDGDTRWVEARAYPVLDPQGELIRCIGVLTDVTDQRRALSLLHIHRSVMESLVEAVVITDATLPDNPVIYANPAFHAMTGHGIEQVLGRNLRFLQGPDSDPESIRQIREGIATSTPVRVEILNYRADGEPFWCALSISPIFDASGRVTHFAGFQSDITRQRAMEAQLSQSERMQAIGRLAGGIAHDFNNVLAVINGYAELMQRLAPPEGPLQNGLREIGRAGERAAGLTRQLLAFSRKQVLTPQILDLRMVLEETAAMLCRVIGEDIRLELDLPDTELTVRADPTQLDQVLLNLAINSRHAMPEGGLLTVSLSRVELTDEDAVPFELAAGDYALLTVADTGQGIPADILPHLFEPFFTTKQNGQGTGLGLATVFGIVKQSAGHISVESSPGAGATFRVYLPLVSDRIHPESPTVESSKPALEAAPCSRQEVVLLVEDEEMVRRVVQAMLERAGYAVVTASNGEAALGIVESGQPIDLLVTDMVMPGSTNGKRLAERARSVRPDLPVLYMSGYTDEIPVVDEAGDREQFLSKPFTVDKLLARVSALLGARGASA